MAGAAPVGTESENSAQKRIPDHPGFNLAVEKTGTHRARKSAIQLQVKTILNLVQHFVGFVYREVHLRCRQGKQLAGNSAGLPNQLGCGVSICGMVEGGGLGARRVAGAKAAAAPAIGAIQYIYYKRTHGTQRGTQDPAQDRSPGKSLKKCPTPSRLNTQPG